MPNTISREVQRASRATENRTISLRFTEKATLAPIVDLLVQVHCNGIIIFSGYTGTDGCLPVVTGLKNNDSVEVGVRRWGGGFKIVSKFVMCGGTKAFTLYSPKSKALIPTDDHFLTGPGAPTEEDEVSVEEELGTDLQIRKVPSASCHPKVILSTGGCTSAELPYQCTIENLLFPLTILPKESYHEGARRFGSRRSGGDRLHAGIDLYAPVGSPVRAMADGIVSFVGEFYDGTDAVEVNHGIFIARYGEVLRGRVLVKVGQKILRGDVIGAVGKLTVVPYSMLHLEMYAKAPAFEGRGVALTQRGDERYKRRNDLIDPTPSIDDSVMD